jgi:hypothetical protein
MKKEQIRNSLLLVLTALVWGIAFVHRAREEMRSGLTALTASVRSLAVWC